MSPSIRLRHLHLVVPFLSATVALAFTSKSCFNLRRESTASSPVLIFLASDDDAAVTEETTIGMPYDENLLYMGISGELDLLPVGESISKQIDYALGGDDAEPSSRTTRTLQIQKLSQRPPLFYIPSALTESDCQQIQNWASRQEFQDAETRMGGDDNGYRKNSYMTWVPNTNEHKGLKSLATHIQSIFLPYEPSLSGIPVLQDGVEDLQVVQYKTSGKYDLHHDGALRILTVLYYLNGVADTWFPLADFKTSNGTPRRMRGRMEALQVVGEGVSEMGVRVSNVKAGDAIAFYSYFQDGSFEWNAIHAGLPAESEKWIATHWYHHVSPNKLKHKQ